MVHTQCSVTASLMTTVTHYRFFHCYYLQERKTVKNLIFLISFFERYRKLPFISTQHHFLFINFVRGNKRGRQKMVKTKNYYKNSHYLIIALNTKTDHSFSILVGKSKLKFPRNSSPKSGTPRANIRFTKASGQSDRANFGISGGLAP